MMSESRRESWNTIQKLLGYVSYDSFEVKEPNVAEITRIKIYEWFMIYVHNLVYCIFPQ